MLPLGSLTVPVTDAAMHSLLGGQAVGHPQKHSIAPLHTPLRHGLATTGVLSLASAYSIALSQLLSSSHWGSSEAHDAHAYSYLVDLHIWAAEVR